MYLHKRKIVQKNKTYFYYALANSVRDPKTKMPKVVFIKQLGTLSPKEVEEWEFKVKAFSGGSSSFCDMSKIQYIESKRYLDVMLYSKIYDSLSMDLVFTTPLSKTIGTREVAKILTIARCLDPMAYYKTADWFKDSYLPDTMNVDPDSYNKDKIFDELSNIGDCRIKLQKTLLELTRKYDKDNLELFFLDGTTTYFEGTECELGQANKDKTNGYQEKVILILLVVNKDGDCVCWDVFQGRDSEKIEIKKLLERMNEEFGIKNVTFCYDRGFATSSIFGLVEDCTGLNSKYVSALNKDQCSSVFDIENFASKTRTKLIERFKASKNDERILPINGFYRFSFDRFYCDLGTIDGKRYIVNFNVNIWNKDQCSRNKNIKDTLEEITKLNEELLSAKETRNETSVAVKLKLILTKKKLSRIIDCEMAPVKINEKVNSFKITAKINQEALTKAELTDGLLIYVTNHTDPYKVSAHSVVNFYRSKFVIENAFRYLKSFLDLRPIYVYLEKHVKAHVDICMLAYFIENYIYKKLNGRYSLEQFSSIIHQHSRVCTIDDGKGSTISITKKPSKELLEILSLLDLREIVSPSFLKNLNLR